MWEQLGPTIGTPYGTLRNCIRRHCVLLRWDHRNTEFSGFSGYETLNLVVFSGFRVITLPMANPYSPSGLLVGLGP